MKREYLPFVSMSKRYNAALSLRPFYVFRARMFVHACGVRAVILEHGALGICRQLASKIVNLSVRFIHSHCVMFFLGSEAPWVSHQVRPGCTFLSLLSMLTQDFCSRRVSCCMGIWLNFLVQLSVSRTINTALTSGCFACTTSIP